MVRQITLKKKRKVLQIGSDCTGLPTDRVALSRLALPFRNRFASESDPQARKTLRRGSDAPEILFHDAKLKKPSRPRVDLYTSGFPCQPFSRAGRGLGWRDHRCLMATVTGYIATKQPRAWILENVAGILNKRHRARVSSCQNTFGELQFKCVTVSWIERDRIWDWTLCVICLNVFDFVEQLLNLSRKTNRVAKQSWRIMLNLAWLI